MEVFVVSSEKFIEAAQSVHGGVYNYDMVEYTKARHRVTIQCREHGVFRQSPTLHLRGAGCPACGQIQRAVSRRARTQWLPFVEARAYIHSLHLPTITAWNAWCKNSRVAGIPACPKITYNNEWGGWGDWLGNVTPWLPFHEARALARSYQLRSSEDWKFFCTDLRQKPDDIPYEPKVIYKDEWAGWGDWLGYKSRANGDLPGALYVIQQSNLPSNVYKIGRTYRLDKRVYEHKRCHGTDITVIYSHQVDNMRVAESAAHRIALQYGTQYQYQSHKEYFMLDDIDTVINVIQQTIE